MGHRHLLGKVVRRARSLGVPACIYTFDPPPRVVLAPQQHKPRVLSWPEKVRLLGQVGIDHVVVERFTRAFAQHPPQWFVEEILARRFAPTEMVVGYDFRFGKARAGGADLVRTLLPDLPLEQVNAEELGGRVVSSSRIRELVGEGDVGEAAVLLGRCHAVEGTVVAGAGRGRTLGYATANLQSDAELLPAPGVYAVRVRVDGGDWLDGVANLGYRPTFNGRTFKVEVHVLDFAADLYGRGLQVAFVQRVRPEQRFADRDALVAQIRRDADAARDRLALDRPGPGAADVPPPALWPAGEQVS